MIQRILIYDKSIRASLSIGLLKLYGLISRPFNFLWMGWVGVFIKKYIKPPGNCTVVFEGKAKFQFYLADYYWNKLVYPGFNYEPEIEKVLRHLLDVNYLLIDLGANYGYWSVLTSSPILGQKEVVAVEPVRLNFEILSANNRLNDNAFTAIRGAITAKEGEKVEIFTNPQALANESASILPSSNYGLTESEMVESFTVDQLVRQFAKENQPVVIKLDVEGMEIDAIRGAKNTLERDVLFIYEDHGNDPQSKVSERILAKGLSVFHLEGGQYTRVSNLKQVEAIKSRSNKGYNLFAYPEHSIFSGCFNPVL